MWNRQMIMLAIFQQILWRLEILNVNTHRFVPTFMKSWFWRPLVWVFDFLKARWGEKWSCDSKFWSRHLRNSLQHQIWAGWKLKMAENGILRLKFMCMILWNCCALAIFKDGERIAHWKSILKAVDQCSDDVGHQIRHLKESLRFTSSFFGRY